MILRTDILQYISKLSRGFQVAVGILETFSGVCLYHCITFGNTSKEIQGRMLW